MGSAWWTPSGGNDDATTGRTHCKGAAGAGNVWSARLLDNVGGAAQREVAAVAGIRAGASALHRYAPSNHATDGARGAQGVPRGAQNGANGAQGC